MRKLVVVSLTALAMSLPVLAQQEGCVRVTSDGPNSNYTVTNCGTLNTAVVLSQPGEGPMLLFIQTGARMPRGTTNKAYRYWSCEQAQGVRKLPIDTRTGALPQYASNSVQCR